MRLIDADEAKSKAIICTNAVIFGDESEGMITFARTALDLLLMALDDAPTIEAEPVRHGYWIPVDGGDTCDEWECSVCGKWMVFQNDMYYDDMFEEFQRCPKCGAKMDGDGA